MLILDYIYKIFFTVVSLSIIGILLFPVAILIRLVISRAPCRCRVWLWILLFIRILCPIALSSVLCINTHWNRSFHILLRKIGLDMPDVNGIMTGWFTVFKSSIETSIAYRAYAVLWLAGVILIWIFVFIKQCQLRKRLKNSVRLYDNVYSVQGLGCPLINGVFRKKIYIPEDMKAADAKYILMHMQKHLKYRDSFFKFIGLLAVSVHWFNLLIWLANYMMNVDIELATDDATVRKQGIDAVKKYAQEIVNMYKKDNMPYSFYTFREKYIEKRASRMLYYKNPLKKSKQIFILVWLICFVWWFMLRPLQILWNGGVSKENKVQQEKDAKLFEEDDKNVVSKLTTLSPDGLDRIVEIVMKDGEYKAGSGYDGEFELILSDTFNTELAKVNLNEVLTKNGDDKLHFDEGLVMYAQDYNNDSALELVLGQDIGSSDESYRKATGEVHNKGKHFVQEYYMWDIEASNLKQIAGPIYSTSKDGNESQSCKFEIINKEEGIFAIKINERNTYYKWDKEKYVQKAYTSSQVEEFKKKQSDKDEGKTKNTHDLKNRIGNAVVRVSTEKDDTGSESIKNLVIDPGGMAEAYTDIKGYFCDIVWANCKDMVSDRYAVLIYNGIKAQTFTIYDTKSGNVFYQNEDGSDVLAEIFKQYDGEEISFKENNIVVYNLKEIDGNAITIEFAADTAEGATVKGSFKYDISKDRHYGFSYIQTN